MADLEQKCQRDTKSSRKKTMLKLALEPKSKAVPGECKSQWMRVSAEQLNSKKRNTHSWRETGNPEGL